MKLLETLVYIYKHWFIYKYKQYKHYKHIFIYKYKQYKHYI